MTRSLATSLEACLGASRHFSKWEGAAGDEETGGEEHELIEEEVPFGEECRRRDLPGGEESCQRDLLPGEERSHHDLLPSRVTASHGGREEDE